MHPARSPAVAIQGRRPHEPLAHFQWHEKGISAAHPLKGPKMRHGEVLRTEACRTNLQSVGSGRRWCWNHAYGIIDVYASPRDGQEQKSAERTDFFVIPNRVPSARPRPPNTRRRTLRRRPMGRPGIPTWSPPSHKWTPGRWAYAGHNGCRGRTAGKTPVIKKSVTFSAV